MSSRKFYLIMIVCMLALYLGCVAFVPGYDWRWGLL